LRHVGARLFAAIMCRKFAIGTTFSWHFSWHLPDQPQTSPPSRDRPGAAFLRGSDLRKQNGMDFCSGPELR
jgi:hypothetical protein